MNEFFSQGFFKLTGVGWYQNAHKKERLKKKKNSASGKGG